MDSLTHIALGACVGEIMLGKRLGKKAMLIGAFANTIPDFDFLAAFWTDADDNLLAHRGFTHSFLFAVLVTGLLALSFQRWFRSRKIPAGTWMWFFAAELFIHLFIDAFNAYGVGWFEPFLHTRVSFHTIFVADPFYSVWLGIALVMLWILKRDHPRRSFWLRFGLGISSLYFMYCVINKVKTSADIRTMLREQSISYTRYFTTPTPLNNWLWYVVAGNDSGFYAGYYSVFDREKKIDLTFFPRNDSLLDLLRNAEDLQHLLRFSQGYYTAEKWHDTLVFNDLRFGQEVGWYDPRSPFVFHYFLQRKDANRLVVQRARFARWNGVTIGRLVRRTMGR